MAEDTSSEEGDGEAGPDYHGWLDSVYIERAGYFRGSAGNRRRRFIGDEKNERAGERRA